MTPGFKVLVRIFDHDHRRIDHRTNGNRNAAQGHDVGIHSLPIHDREGCENPQRQADDGDQCRPEVEQKQRAHQSDNHELLDQAVAQSGN